MAASEKSLIAFSKRALPGLLLVALGLLIGIGHKSWSAEVTPFAYPLALLLAVGGCSRVGSHVQQRPFRPMRMELFSSAVFVRSLWLSFLAFK